MKEQIKLPEKTCFDFQFWFIWIINELKAFLKKSVIFSLNVILKSRVSHKTVNCDDL